MVVIAICITCMLIKNYNKKSVVKASNKINNHNRTAIKKKKKFDLTDKDKGIEVFKIKSKPGEVFPWIEQKNNSKKIAYLTFDDGPSINTRKILKILDDNKIKGTFFFNRKKR